jgi:hypothetical protein
MPRKRRLAVKTSPVAMCQLQTHAVQQKAASFDRLVSAGEQRQSIVPDLDHD